MSISNASVEGHTQQPHRRFELWFKFVQSSLPMILLIIVIWLLAVVLIHPQGNFPLSDDWAYGGAVKSLLDSGSVKLPDWCAPNLIAQMFWGALFCLPTGFSFTALRVSTLVLGLLGVL